MGLGYRWSRHLWLEKQRIAARPPPGWNKPYGSYGESCKSHVIVLRHVPDGRPITYAWSKFSKEAVFSFHARLKLKTLQHDLKHTRIKQIWQNVGELDLCDTVLRCTYVCAPGKRNFDHRRQLCRSYHFSESCLEYFARAIVVEICWNQNLGLPLDIFWLSTFFKRRT